MNLYRKTVVYSLALAAVFMTLLILFFLLLLPSLYVDYTDERNYETTLAQHLSYIDKGAFDRTPTSATLTLAVFDIPKQGSVIEAHSYAFDLEVRLLDERLVGLLDKLRGMAQDSGQLPDGDFDAGFFTEEDWVTLRDVLSPAGLSPWSDVLDVSVTTNVTAAGLTMVRASTSAITGGVGMRAMLSDGETNYSTYVMFGETETSYILTGCWALTPRITEIRPIVLQSLPAVAAVTLLVVLLASQFFSGQVVGPVLRIASHVREATERADLPLKPLTVRGKDEISTLARDIDRTFARLRESYGSLESANRTLTLRARQQQVFLKASSHQLKTPLASAMLLLDGVIGKVGKYADADTYLPEVKKQLLSMRSIITEILTIEDSLAPVVISETKMDELLEGCLAACRAQAEEKGLELLVSGPGAVWQTDASVTAKIIDNLLSNAVAHTQAGGGIHVELSGACLSVRNAPAHIDERMLPHIREPFVTSRREAGGGHGLGLYVASYLAEILGCELTVENTDDGVRASLTAPQRPELDN